MTTTVPTSAPSDRKVLRRRARVEDRIAERSAELELEDRRCQLKEQRSEQQRAARKRQRQNGARRRKSKRDRLRERGLALLRRIRTVCVAAGERVIVAPILIATTSAWWFQFDAMRATGQPVLLSGMVATALEALGLSFAGLAHKARAGDDTAALYRTGMWAVVAAAAAVNYRHGSIAWDRPGVTGLVFAMLSVASVGGGNSVNVRPSASATPTGSHCGGRSLAAHAGSGSLSRPVVRHRLPFALG